AVARAIGSNTAGPLPYPRRRTPVPERIKREIETQRSPDASPNLAIILSKRRESTIESYCMKSIILVLLAAVVAPAAEFSTGQAARLVIGQRTFTEALQGARQDLVGGVSGIAYAGDMLFVVDANRVGAAPVNQRVLIFK